MLTKRAELILQTIVGKYITNAVPVPSHSISDEAELNVSSATIRNEMAHLEQEGYITRPHTSAGSVPLDKGYRSYVTSLGDVQFPVSEQRLINHLFHQVEGELEAWLNLAATLTAQKSNNIALVSLPRTPACQFKHLELVNLQDSLALLVLVLRGAKVRQQLITFETAVTQTELTVIAARLSELFSGLTATGISDTRENLNEEEQLVMEYLVKIMESEDSQEYDQTFIDGLHFTLNQPELTRNVMLAHTLTELIEQRSLLKVIAPSKLSSEGVQVVIGKENGEEAIQDYSVVIGRYGIADDALGTVCVIGPTRMPYGRTMATVGYLSVVLSGLISKLYGGESPAGGHAGGIGD